MLSKKEKQRQKTKPGGVRSETGSDSLQGVCVPHLWVPGLEPAGEGGRLFSLSDGGDGHAPAAGGVRLHVVCGCVERRTDMTKGSPARLKLKKTEAKQSVSGALLFFLEGFLCSRPILGASLRSSALASLPTQRKIYEEEKNTLSHSGSLYFWSLRHTDTCKGLDSCRRSGERTAGRTGKHPNGANTELWDGKMMHLWHHNRNGFVILLTVN